MLCDLQAFEYRAPLYVALTKASRMEQWLKYPIKDFIGIESWWQDALGHNNNVRPKGSRTYLHNPFIRIDDSDKTKPVTPYLLPTIQIQ